MEQLKPCSVILYTTLYRDGGPKFKRVAETKLAQLRSQGKDVICEAVESKAEFMRVLTETGESGRTIEELHFFGHSGMYGIMFGSKEWPEQFSPFEWKNMVLPVTASSKLYFHSCRSGRWFAPFLSRTLNVCAYGYENYTTVSLRPDRFQWEGFNGEDKDLYIIACPGKKSHGLGASLSKYLGFAKADAFLEFTPSREEVDTTYDNVAELYADTFEDIVVRSDELKWLESKLEEIRPQAVLDIGCGNGAFLQKLSPFFGRGVGVDLSAGMLEQARRRAAAKNNGKLDFVKIDGPALPFADNSFDVVTSTLSFRYLDWDPIVAEILRVLKPGGRFLVLDMVAAPVKWHEVGALLLSKMRLQIQRLVYRQYYRALTKMVSSQAWRKMLKYNPIRSEHEMRWYLESRFTGRNAEIINVGMNSRILAFDSGALSVKRVEKMSYP